MKLLVWNDGRVVEATDFRLICPYVMQRIQTLGHRPYNLSRHLSLLNDTAISLFGFATLCRVADAERIITKLLDASRVSLSLSTPVVMRLDSSGALSFEVESPTLYDGYAVRARRLSLATLSMSLPDTISQTSVTVAIDAMADSRVKSVGGDMALWVDEHDEAISRPWLPLFAVYHGRVYTPAEYDSVEYVVVRDAVRRAGMELVIHPLSLSSLMRMEEIFMADTMGITSFASFKEHRLLSIAATRIAEAINSIR